MIMLRYHDKFEEFNSQFGMFVTNCPIQPHLVLNLFLIKTSEQIQRNSSGIHQTRRSGFYWIMWKSCWTRRWNKQRLMSSWSVQFSYMVKCRKCTVVWTDMLPVKVSLLAKFHLFNHWAQDFMRLSVKIELYNSKNLLDLLLIEGSCCSEEKHSVKFNCNTVVKTFTICWTLSFNF